MANCDRQRAASSARCISPRNQSTPPKNNRKRNCACYPHLLAFSATTTTTTSCCETSVLEPTGKDFSRGGHLSTGTAQDRTVRAWRVLPMMLSVPLVEAVQEAVL